MPKIWWEPFRSGHSNPMGLEVGDVPSHDRYFRAPTLEPTRVLFVRVAGFTFEFHSRRQLDACLDYYKREHHPSSANRGIAEFIAKQPEERRWSERWFERLPMYLLEKPKRAQVVSALTKASLTSADWES